MSWENFYSKYDVEACDLSSRLSVVKKYILDINNSYKPKNIVSICGGKGLDIIDTLKDDQKLFILDNDLDAKRHVDLNKKDNVNFLLKDATLSNSYKNIPKADLLICVGFIGCIKEKSIEDFISFLPQIINKNGIIIWTVRTTSFENLKNLIGLFEKYNFETTGFRITNFNQFACFKSEFNGYPEDLELNKHLMYFDWSTNF